MATRRTRRGSGGDGDAPTALILHAGDTGRMYLGQAVIAPRRQGASDHLVPSDSARAGAGLPPYLHTDGRDSANRTSDDPRCRGDRLFPVLSGNAVRIPRVVYCRGMRTRLELTIGRCFSHRSDARMSHQCSELSPAEMDPLGDRACGTRYQRRRSVRRWFRQLPGVPPVSSGSGTRAKLPTGRVPFRSRAAVTDRCRASWYPRGGGNDPIHRVLKDDGVPEERGLPATGWIPVPPIAGDVSCPS